MIPVLVSQEKGLEFGLQVGEVYYLRRSGISDISVRIAGFWAPTDPLAPYWEPSSTNALFVPEDTYAQRLAPVLEDELQTAQWYLVFDGRDLHASDVAGLLRHFQSIRRTLEAEFPGIQLLSSPLAELERYQAEAPALTLLLYAFAIPIAGLTLAFIGLVTGMFIAQHQHEIAMLRSRGASVLHAAGITAAEGLAMAALALALGIPAGLYLAARIGQARSFLDFSDSIHLRIALTPTSLGYALGAILFIVIVQIGLLTALAARRTIVSYRQERARQTQRPWWQRSYLDLLTLAPAVYALWVLRQQGSLAAQGAAQGAAALTNPLQNPLLLLSPALVLLACTLLLLRLLPSLMSLLAWAAARTNSVGFLMAARYLARSPAFYNTPLSLLILTFSLSAYTASLAYTLDRQLYRQTFYQVGADLSITEDGILPPHNPGESARGQSLTPPPVSLSASSYLFDPVADHLRIPGVLAATRVGIHSAAFAQAGGKQIPGVFIGIDPLTFASVAYWQRDFASPSLGALMNAIAATPNGALVSRAYLEQQGLKTGDPLDLVVTAQSNFPTHLVVVGSVDLFPSWYPDQGPLVVANLSDFYTQANAEYPHQVWLKLAPQADPAQILRSVRGFTASFDPGIPMQEIDQNGLNTFVETWSASADLVLAAQRSPARQGLFGLLSVGFISSALLTVLGFLLYALFSFRRRFIELGMLRAIGLSAAQMTGLLASELAFLTGGGLVVGTLLGVSASRLFIPFMQAGAAADRYPPFVTLIAWPAIFEMAALFAGLFLIALGVLVALLRRMKIFQAIKLGETT